MRGAELAIEYNKTQEQCCNELKVEQWSAELA